MKKTEVIPILLVVLLSAFFIPNSYSLFRNSNVLAGNIRTAIWSVSLNQVNVNNTLNVTPGSVTADYTLNVVSNSEVDIIYTIVISNVPEGIEVSLDNGEFVPQTDNVITFTDAGTILYSSQTKQNSHTLTFKAEPGTEIISNREVDIDVITTQIL